MKVFIAPASSLQGSVKAPSSKNYSTRYLWISALTNGESIIYSPAQNDDARALISCCQNLGADIKEGEDYIKIKGFGRSPNDISNLNPENGGLVLRLLLALGLFLREVRYTTRFQESLGKRPQGDLLAALRLLGAEVEDEDGHLPITIRGGRPVIQREVEVSGLLSSQYATALLMIAPLLGGIKLRITGGLSSKPPLATTLQVMQEAGVEVNADWSHLFFQVPALEYQPGEYRVPGDYPAASALLAAAALLPSNVVISNLHPDDQQGEKKIIPYLRKMGVEIEARDCEVMVKGGNPLQAIDFYGDDAIDAVLSMAAVAAFAQGTTRFMRVANLRWKESDRIGDFARELRKLGVKVKELADGFIIKGSPKGYEGGIEINTYHDHRMVMTFSILALRTRKGLVINGAEHVNKSYPGFFSDLTSLGATIKVLSD